MAASTYLRSRRRSQATFWIGLGLIAFASIRNLILARVAPEKLYLVPTFTPDGAMESYNLAVTLAVVGVGMVVLLWHEIVAGFMTLSWYLGRDMYRPEESKAASQPVQRKIRYDYVQGGVSLDTAKYLPRGSKPDFDLFGGTGA